MGKGGQGRSSSKAEPLIDQAQIEEEQPGDDDESLTYSITSNLSENVGNTTQGFVNEARNVRDAFVGDLTSANDGDDFFLDMAVTRALSILPCDVVRLANDYSHVGADDDVLEEEQKHDSDPEEPLSSPASLSTPSSPPVRAYLLLAATVVALASFGPLLDLQEDCSGSMKTLWRQLGTSILIIPPTIWELRRDGLPQLNAPQYLTLLVATLCYAMMGVGFVVGLQYTSVGNAVILANSQAIILLLGKAFVGERMTFLEAAGAITAFTGAILFSQDKKAGSGDEEGHHALFGDLVVFLCCGVGGVGYLILSKSMRSSINLMTYTFLTMFMGCLMILPFQIFILRETVTFDMNIEYGIWGFLNKRFDRLPVELIQILFG